MFDFAPNWNRSGSTTKTNAHTWVHLKGMGAQFLSAVIWTSFPLFFSIRKVPDCHEEPSCSISLFSRPFCLSFIVGYFLPVGIAFVQFTEYYGYFFHFSYFLSLIFCCAFDSGLLICGSSFRTAHRVLRISFSFFLLPFALFFVIP